MTFPEQYRTELLNAIRGIDLEGVSKAIDWFLEARAHGRCIFVCGTGSGASAASRLLSDMVKSSTFNRSARFRIVALSAELPNVRDLADDPAQERVFVEQLKNIAERGDVVVGISPSGNAASILRAFEYAKMIGCRTISITGRDAERLATMTNVAILVPASHPGSVEDAHMIICHMIGYYFQTVDAA